MHRACHQVLHRGRHARPKGTAEYDRFVRKHDRYFALAATGDIASGVSHVDPDLSPYEPPATEAIAELNTRMLIRAGDPGGVS